MSDESEARAAVSALVMTYAERMDLGDFAGVAALFAGATYRAMTPNGIATQDGADAVLATLQALVQTYDGIPGTKHVTTNLIVDVDVGAQRATCRSYFTVFQGRPAWGLHPIVAGRYHDEFVIGPDGWRFSDRLIFTDLVGDVSHHLRGDVLK
ncbi:MAG: nuclear transport factor 2 family protein [Acidimicrobiales bacterium]